MSPPIQHASSNETMEPGFRRPTAFPRRLGQSLSAVFTLIELLIVVAIIGVLCSMLLPVLKQAREKALSISCLNNLKQLSSGLQLYYSDHDGLNPGPLLDAAATTWLAIPAYYFGKIDRIANSDFDNQCYLPENYGPLRCPADKSVLPNGKKTTNYGMNGAYNFETSTNAYGMDKRRLASVGRPSSVMLIGDGRGNKYVSSNASCRLCNVAPGLSNGQEVEEATRHPANMINFVFVDIHAESRKSEEIKTEVGHGGNSVFFDRHQKF